MNNNLISFVIAGTIVLTSVVVSYTMYNLNDRNNMAKNIEAAINKGVDPLSVKCAFISGYDPVCVAYAASGGTSVISTTQNSTASKK